MLTLSRPRGLSFWLHPEGVGNEVGEVVMARLQDIPREQIAEEHQEIYDGISATLGRLPAVMEILMYRPVVAGMTDK